MIPAGIVRRGGGFTLLEVLLALSLLAVVLSTLYGAFAVTMRSIEAAERQADSNAKARIALARIREDLAGSYFGPGGSLIGQRGEIAGMRADTLAFTSTAHLALTRNAPPAAYSRIGYTVQQDGDSSLLRLFRSDLPFRPGLFTEEAAQAKGYLVCDGLLEVRFVYYDQAGNEADSWRMEAESGRDDEQERKRPAMIEVTLRFADAEPQGRLFRTAVSLPAAKKRGGG